MIIGIDHSISSPAVSLDGAIIYVTTNPKMCLQFEKSGILFKGKLATMSSDDDDTERFLETSRLLTEDWIGNIKSGVAYIEDYAFGAKGQLTRIAESTGTTKVMLKLSGWEIKKVSPGQIKIQGYGKGNANKEQMAHAWYESFGWYVHEEFGVKVNASPATDIIDAYYARELGKNRENDNQ